MKHNKSLKLVCATMLTIFNLFVCFMGTWAWFTAAKQTAGDNMTMVMEAHELHLDYNIYKFDDNLKEVVKANDFNLNPYDSIITERNATTPIVLQTTLFSTLFINADTYDVDISIKCTETSAYTNFLSNITHFKFGALTIDSEDANDIYSDSLSELENVNPLKFITTVKLTQITFTIYNAPIIDNKITIYGLFNYDETLISAKNIDIYDEVPTFVNDIEYVRYGVHD